ncbi:anti-phage dCTP deaminase [Rhodoferax antarcticus]|uniref:anti-phage dCTP deaminase n=1 Tax=Rhodoferax antarcticus TaxID=81479 RepID=UPI002225103B|nr:anti-phage dCTP deaminase [Rhodoferax antarcticus]MCW2313410.1 deoxycytidylate deaminase [Rhodoferax antarcticus]
MPALRKAFDSIELSKTKNKMGLINKFDARRSQELVIALAGPIGCGIGGVADALEDRLKERGYVEVIRIKLSDFLELAVTDKLIENPQYDEKKSARYNRYRKLQEAGKELRKKTGNPAVLAEFAARQISLDRIKRNGTDHDPDNGPLVPLRVAYIIDQVKRPEEVTLLRALYRNLFYLAGVTRIYDRREAVLIAESIRKDEVDGLMEIDRMEDRDDGQQLDKTLFLADYFIRNDSMAADEKIVKLNRFLNLIHGDQSITPTDVESGMFAAFSASLKSACLSRQVGAAITARSGEIIATGCNDVPMAGGGLYSHSSQSDMRCIHHEGRQCFNDLHKRKLQKDVGEIIDKVLFAENDELGDEDKPIRLHKQRREKLLEAIYKQTRIKDLIEYSRSVHAEMDAIVSLARIGSSGLEGATLYTTTFPCHNCARHIVASGIMKVFYVEPYEKSLAKELHADAIAFEIEESKGEDPKRVEFLHFEGVAPRQFHSMFRADGRKNSDGKFVPIRVQSADKAIPEYLDGYQDFEIKAVEHLEEELDALRENPSKTIRQVSAKPLE